MTLLLRRPILGHGSQGCRRGLSASARKFSNRAGGLRLREGKAGLAIDVRHCCCLPPDRTRSAQQKDVFGARYTARLCLCERFATPITRRDASLEAGAAG